MFIMKNYKRLFPAWIAALLTIGTTGLFMYAFLKLSPYPPEHPLWLTAGAAAVFGVIFFILPGAEQGRDSLQPPVWGKGNNKQPNAAIAKIVSKSNLVIPSLHAEPKGNPNDTVTFADIAGYDKTKDSMKYLVQCLSNPEILEEAGAKLPSGVLLYGPPGTGKTLFARALANEAGVSFFSVSASEFIELYVGQGSRNIRSLYEDARKAAPCIVFIDEIDAVGTQRNGQMHDERRQTINALLTEVGSVKNKGILTVAATNDVDSLDSALKRPGRFDRVIAIPNPDLEDRRAIIKYYFSKKKIAEDVSLENLALMTEGRSGSFIATVINEAAIHAASEKRRILAQKDIDEALFQVLMNGEKKSVTNQKDLKIVAYHEAGHAIATKLLTTNIVPSVTIVGSTSGAGGVTFHHAAEERAFTSKSEMKNEIRVCYAGRAAEECFFGNKDDITTGASSDLQNASILLRNYFNIFGMGDNLLNVSAFTGTLDDNKISIDDANLLASQLYDDTLHMLQGNRELLDAVAQALLAKKSLSDKELTRIIAQYEKDIA